jgi:trehalose 6-phosphate synthase/phosphatase
VTAAVLPQNGRIILVSNRLPVTVQLYGQEVSLEASSGGLATGLRGPHEQSDGIWVGWPGLTGRVTPEQRARIEEAVEVSGLRAVHLTVEEVRGFYEAFSNGVIWPVLHSLIEELPLEIRGWPEYCRANEKFSRVVVDNYQEGDMVWIHDYQLMLLPGLIRAALPDANIGFFLHVPFPPPEIFRAIARHEELLRGLLGANLIGFHTQDYLDNFSRTVTSEGLARRSKSGLFSGGRRSRLRVFPMGIDTSSWQHLADSSDVQARASDLKESAGTKKLLLGIDRLDYTKGLPRRIKAIELLLEQDPSLSEVFHYIQIVVPSRERIDSYAGLLRRLSEMVGRINGTYGTTNGAPINLIHRSIPDEEVSALYAAADVMLVTPLRDGMNLVAKEFVASRLRQDGVLILSEFAGAAHEMKQALLVNAYDAVEIAERIREALVMPQQEQQRRMRRLQEAVCRSDVHRWVQSFVSELSQI